MLLCAPGPLPGSAWWMRNFAQHACREIDALHCERFAQKLKESRATCGEKTAQRACAEKLAPLVALPKTCIKNLQGQTPAEKFREVAPRTWQRNLQRTCAEKLAVRLLQLLVGLGCPIPSLPTDRAMDLPSRCGHFRAGREAPL